MLPMAVGFSLVRTELQMEILLLSISHTLMMTRLFLTVFHWILLMRQMQISLLGMILHRFFESIKNNFVYHPY